MRAFHWWRSGNKKRTQNVGEYMLVLALCLVEFSSQLVLDCAKETTQRVNDFIGYVGRIHVPRQQSHSVLRPVTGDDSQRDLDSRSVLAPLCSLNPRETNDESAVVRRCRGTRGAARRTNSRPSSNEQMLLIKTRFDAVARPTLRRGGRRAAASRKRGRTVDDASAA